MVISKSASKDPGDLPEGLEQSRSQSSDLAARKQMENGNLFVLTPDNRKYTVNGQMTK
jgi:hypothetical protein